MNSIADNKNHNETRQVKLKEICEITVGHVGPMAKEYVESGIPFLRSQNVLPFKLNVSNIKYISCEFHKKLKKSALYPGNTCCCTNWLSWYSLCHTKKSAEANCSDLVIIKPHKDVSSSYLAYIFNSTWGIDSVKGNLVGVAQQHFNVSSAKELEITLPSIEIQNRIVSILSAYDDLIEVNDRRIRLLEEMAQLIYREWFVNFRFPGHENVKMVESEMRQTPEMWDVKKISDISIIYRGKSYRSSELVDIGGLPFLNLKCIERGGGFCFNGIKRFDGDYKNSQTAKPGDIIVGLTDMTQERRLVAHAARVPNIGYNILCHVNRFNKNRA